MYRLSRASRPRHGSFSSGDDRGKAKLARGPGTTLTQERYVLKRETNNKCENLPILRNVRDHHDAAARRCITSAYDATCLRCRFGFLQGAVDNQPKISHSHPAMWHINDSLYYCFGWACAYRFATGLPRRCRPPTSVWLRAASTARSHACGLPSRSHEFEDRANVTSDPDKPSMLWFTESSHAWTFSWDLMVDPCTIALNAQTY